MHNHGEHLHIKGRYALAVDDGNAYLAAGLAGLGVLWLPEYMSRAHQTRGELVQMLEGWRLDQVTLYVAFPPTQNIIPKLRSLFHRVVALLADLAPVIARAVGRASCREGGIQDVLIRV